MPEKLCRNDIHTLEAASRSEHKLIHIIISFTNNLIHISLIN